MAKLARFFGPITSIIPSFFGVGITACAGGVCSAAISSVASATSTTLSAAAAGSAALAGSSPYLQSYFPALSPHIAHVHELGWMQKGAVLVLLAAIFWMIHALRQHPKAVLLVSVAGLWNIAADLLWLPGGAHAIPTAIAFSIPVFLGANYFSTYRFPSSISLSRTVAALSLFAMLSALTLQFVSGWHPCLDCWLERAALLLILLISLLPLRGVSLAIRRPSILMGSLFLLYALAAVQSLEVQNAPAVSGIARFCSSVGPSCAHAGSRVLLGFPIVQELLVLIAVLFFLASGLWIRSPDHN